MTEINLLLLLYYIRYCSTVITNLLFNFSNSLDFKKHDFNFFFQVLQNSIRIRRNLALQRYRNTATLQFALSHNALAV